jgi:hypothetical protein
MASVQSSGRPKPHTPEVEMRKPRRPSHATVVAYIALFVALGGSAVAASNLGKNSVGPTELKKNAVTTAKIKKQAVTTAKIKKQAITAATVKNGTLTGAQINVSTLGTVPTAQTANNLAAPEAWHEVGAPGQPGYLNNWKQAAPNAYNAAFFKDHEGIVHLRGVVSGGTAGSIFQLPPGYRPAAGKLSAFAAFCAGGGCTGANVGVLGIFGSGINPAVDGTVSGTAGAGTVGLDGVTFRAES